MINQMSSNKFKSKPSVEFLNYVKEVIAKIILRNRDYCCISMIMKWALSELRVNSILT